MQRRGGDGGGSIRALPTMDDVRLRDRYTLGRTVGVGGFSVVRMAIDKETEEQWACKVVPLKPEREATAYGEVQDGRVSKADFLNEVELHSWMRHENITSLREAFIEEGNAYLIMELMPGGELSSVLADRGCLCEEDAREIFCRLLLALGYLHTNEIIHRDIKLENLLLKSADDITSVKLCDFGLARQAKGSDAQSQIYSARDLSSLVAGSDAGEHKFRGVVSRNISYSGVTMGTGQQEKPPEWAEMEKRTRMARQSSLQAGRSHLTMITGSRVPSDSRRSRAVSDRTDADSGRLQLTPSRSLSQPNLKAGDKTSVCGTLTYLAPELVGPNTAAYGKTAAYSKSTDMWAAGVLLFYLLGGYPPFGGDDADRDGGEPTNILRGIRAGRFEFSDPVWDLTSDEAKDLITRLLSVHPKSRLSAEEAIKHPWCRGERMEASAPPEGQGYSPHHLKPRGPRFSTSDREPDELLSGLAATPHL